MIGVPQLSVSLTDAENGELNPLGINCLRTFPVIGTVICALALPALVRYDARNPKRE